MDRMITEEMQNFLDHSALHPLNEALVTVGNAPRLFEALLTGAEAHPSFCTTKQNEFFQCSPARR